MNPNDPSIKQQARQMTNRLIDQGVVLKKSRCERCGGLNPVINHLDYFNPAKVNFLCYRCHMLYHEYRDDGVPGSTPALPDSLVIAYRRYRRVRALWLYWLWYPLRYFHRRFFPLAAPIVVNRYRPSSIWDRLGLPESLNQAPAQNTA